MYIDNMYKYIYTNVPKKGNDAFIIFDILTPFLEHWEQSLRIKSNKVKLQSQ